MQQQALGSVNTLTRPLPEAEGGQSHHSWGTAGTCPGSVCGHKYLTESDNQGGLLLSPEASQLLMASHSHPGSGGRTEGRGETEAQPRSPCFQTDVPADHTSSAPSSDKCPQLSAVWRLSPHLLPPALGQGQWGLHHLLSPGPRPRPLTCVSFPGLLCPVAQGQERSFVHKFPTQLQTACGSDPSLRPQ